MGDTGLTGRKILVDTNGGITLHGGDAFSGKDPSKVDRSAAYAMRWVAKTSVAVVLASRVEVQVAYAIGEGVAGRGCAWRRSTPRPSTRRRSRPAAIVRDLGLIRPIYAQTSPSPYGEFGRPDLDLPWERTGRVDELTRAVMS